MQPKLRLSLLFAAAALCGCVSLGTYRSMVDQNKDLQERLADSRQSKADLDAKNTELEATASDLTNQDTALTDKNTSLETINAALAAKDLAQKAQFDALEQGLKAEVDAGQVRITRYRDMVSLDVVDSILFDSAKADLRDEGKALLLRVGKVLANGDKIVRVTGHTDDQLLAKGAGFADNWDLSTARAVTVVRFLHSQAGVDPTRLMAAGRGKWAPVAPNDTPENRQRNRRIEISLVDRSLVEGK